MTREELDELERDLRVSNRWALGLTDVFAQARRAIDLEEQLRQAAITYCGKAIGEYGMCARELGHDGDCRRTR